MASNVQTPLADQTRHMVAQTKTLLNDQLRKVLKEEGLAVSGVKAELQLRIINRTGPLWTHCSPPSRLPPPS
jgi:E3 SUMO-protein ligase PIAS1